MIKQYSYRLSWKCENGYESKMYTWDKYEAQNRLEQFARYRTECTAYELNRIDNEEKIVGRSWYQSGRWNWFFEK